MRVLLSFFIISNIWALEDRALFSVSDKVYFVKEVNTYIETLNKIKCVQKVNLVRKLIDVDKDFHALDVSKKIESLLDRIIANKALILIKVINSSGVKKDKNVSAAIVKNCSNGAKIDIENLKEILAANDFLKQRISTLPKSNSVSRNIELLKNNYISPVEYRTFY